MKKALKIIGIILAVILVILLLVYIFILNYPKLKKEVVSGIRQRDEGLRGRLSIIVQTAFKSLIKTGSAVMQSQFLYVIYYLASMFLIFFCQDIVYIPLFFTISD